MQIIDLVLEMYSPENYKVLTVESFKLDLLDMLSEIDLIEQELPPEKTLQEILEENEISYEKLIKMCKSEKSFAFS